MKSLLFLVYSHRKLVIMFLNLNPCTFSLCYITLQFTQIIIMSLAKTLSSFLFTHTYTSHYKYTKQTYIYLNFHGDEIPNQNLTFYYSEDKCCGYISQIIKLRSKLVSRYTDRSPDSNNYLKRYSNIFKIIYDFVKRGLAPRLTES